MSFVVPLRGSIILPSDPSSERGTAYRQWDDREAAARDRPCRLRRGARKSDRRAPVVGMCVVSAPARRVVEMPRSGIRAVMDLAAAVPDALHLEVGEPNFPTPPHIVEAAAVAAREGHTKYTPSRGYPALREAIAAKVRTQNGIPTTTDGVVVVSGAVTGLIEAFLAIVEPGDAILLPDPGWPNTEMMVVLAGGRPVRYPLLREAGYEPDLDALRALVRRERPKAIYVNSPGNPTGSVFSQATIEALCELAATADAFIVSDECYEAITFDAEHRSPGALAPDRTLSAFSFSKTYAMTGWRVGYLVAPAAIADLVAKLQEPVISCASAISQKAAEAALAGPQDVVAAMVAEYRARRDVVVPMLRDVGMLVAEPRGAFYVMADVTRSGLDGREFALRLIADRGVAVAPGDTFGPAGRHLIRISLASDIETIVEGARRIIEFASWRT